MKQLEKLNDKIAGVALGACDDSNSIETAAIDYGRSRAGIKKMTAGVNRLSGKVAKLSALIDQADAILAQGVYKTP